MKFYNFGNEPTYHFFWWATEGKGVDCDKLVREAFESIEIDDALTADDDFSLIACEILAHLLEEACLKYMEILEIPESGFGWPGEVGIDCNLLPHGALSLPLLNWAIAQINFGVVAQAILMKAGKWAPDQTIPEIR